MTLALFAARNNLRFPWRLVILAMLVATAGAQDFISTFVLERDQAAEREISGAQKHRYHLTLSAGQFLRVEVEQLGIDVSLALADPAGTMLHALNFNDKLTGQEELVCLAATSGVYALEIRAANAKAPAGRYRVQIAELVQAGPREQDYVKAQSLQMEGYRLSNEQKAESLRAALDKYEAALPLWQKLGVRHQESAVLRELATTHYYLGARPKALQYFQQQLPLVRAANNSAELGSALNNLGLLHWQTGKPEQGLEYLQEALLLRRAVGDKGGEATTLHNLGLLYESRHEYQLALEQHLLALPLRRAVGDKSGEAFTLTSLGGMARLQAEYSQALAYHQQACAIRREIKDARNLANSLYNLGGIQRLQGNFQQALDSFSEALTVVRPTGYKYNEALILSETGLTYLELGEPRQAQDYLTESLPLYRTVNDRVGEARVLNALGQLLMKTDAAQAVNYYNQALALLRAIGQRQVEEAAVLINLGSALKKMGQAQQALAHYEQALTLARSVNARAQESNALNSLGVFWHEAKNADKSREYHQQAIAAAQAVSHKTNEARSRYSLGVVDARAGELTQALAHVEASINLIETLRDSVGSPDLRATFAGEFQMFYQLQTQTLMRLHAEQPNAGYAQKAWQAGERARARGLVELLREARIDLRQGADATLLDRERTLQQRINARASQRENLAVNKQNEAQLAKLETELRTLAGDLEQTRTQLRARSPHYAALMQPQPLTVAEIQKELDAETLLLEYAFTEQEAYLWAVAPDSFHSYRLASSAEIEAAARRVYDLLNVRQRVAGKPEAQQDKLIAEAEAKFPAEAAALSQMLLAPVATQLGKKRLLIVAPGALQYVPFATLPAPNDERGTMNAEKGKSDRSSLIGQPLIVDHEIVYLPSASVLTVLRRETAGRVAAPKSIAVLADPVFEARDPRVKAGGSQATLAATKSDPIAAPLRSPLERALEANEGDRAYLARLPHSRKEAEGIAALAPGGLQALDFQASRATAISEELSRYRIVHFATHGLLNSTQPELSGLVFSLLNEKGERQDGFVRLHEIYNLKLPADLIVLSACQTALGKEVKGEGLLGLTRGFMYAGAPRVVASLWQVNDAATADLMKRFYQGMLRDGKRPAAALREAQLALWKKKPTRAPYFWAAFVLQGEWK